MSTATPGKMALMFKATPRVVLTNIATTTRVHRPMVELNAMNTVLALVLLTREIPAMAGETMTVTALATLRQKPDPGVAGKSVNVGHHDRPLRRLHEIQYL